MTYMFRYERTLTLIRFLHNTYLKYRCILTNCNSSNVLYISVVKIVHDTNNEWLIYKTVDKSYSELAFRIIFEKSQNGCTNEKIQS